MPKIFIHLGSTLGMFTPSQWADPMFLAFVKEYWELSFKQKYPNVTVTVVFYISPDNAEVTQDILVHFEVVGGVVTPRLLLGRKMAKTTNAVFFAGNPAAWQKVAQTGSIEPLQGRVVIPDDNFKFVKGEIAKSFFAIGNRIADRMAQGARPSISVADSIRYDEPAPVSLGGPVPQVGTPASVVRSQKSAFEKLDEGEYTKFFVGGREVGSRKLMIKLTYETELKSLRELGPNKMDKYWKKVEELPLKEKYMAETDPEQLDILLFAVPNLRSDLLAFRGKGADGKEEFKLVEQYLNEKIKAAAVALEAEEKSARSESASAAPAPTEPSTFIEFPGKSIGINMTCHIDFKEPVLLNTNDDLAMTKGLLENLDRLQDFYFKISGGRQIANRQKGREQNLLEELEQLKKAGHKHLDKYWKHVESLPSKETFELGKTSFGMLIPLMATPTLRSDLLALRGKAAEAKQEYAQVEKYLKMQLKG